MSKYKNFKERVIAAKIPERNSGVIFFRNNPDIYEFCKGMLEKYSELFGSCGDVMRALFMGKKIRRCKVCGKRLNYRNSNVLVHGKPMKYCSKECRISDNEDAKLIRANTMKEKYGVENISQLQSTKDKKIQKSLEKYGVENVAQSKEVKDKMKQTNLEKYGVEYPAQSEEVSAKVSKSKRNRTEEQLLSELSKSRETHRNRFFPYVEKWLKEYDLEFVNPDEYIGLNHHYFLKEKPDGYKLRCLKCGEEFYQIIRKDKDLSYWCPNCNKGLRSQGEKELREWVSSLGYEVIGNCRSLIAPKEIDLFIPDKKICIEYNGLYWHSDTCLGDKNYHKNKTDEVEKLGYQLIQVFEDEWIYKKDLMKSVISAKMGIFEKRFYARQCELREVSCHESSEFLTNNHLQGDVRCKVNLGLFYNDELVSLMNFSKPRFTKNYDWELVRFCNKMGVTVVGGANKLLSHFEKNYEGSIISYADRRYSNGNMYETLGFDFQGYTKPNYFYVKGLERYNRMKFQKHKLPQLLENFDPNKSEGENMIEHGYNKIYDCGNRVYVRN